MLNPKNQLVTRHLLWSIVILIAVGFGEGTIYAMTELTVTDGLQVWLRADVGIGVNGDGTIQDGDEVISWTDQAHAHTFNAKEGVRWIRDAGGGLAGLDFQRGQESGFLGDFSSTVSSGVVTEATVFVIGKFGGYTHPATEPSFWLAIDSSTAGREVNLGRGYRSAVRDNAIFYDPGEVMETNYFTGQVFEPENGDFLYYTGRYSVGDTFGANAWMNEFDMNLFPVTAESVVGVEVDPRLTYIGNNPEGDAGLDGIIREILIYDRELSGAEIMEIHAYLADRVSGEPLPREPTIPGDANGDGVVNGQDFAMWRENAGMAGGASADKGDFDGDGDVDGFDFLIWQNGFGQSVESLVEGENNSIPEPGGMMIVAFACMIGGIRRH